MERSGVGRNSADGFLQSDLGVTEGRAQNWLDDRDRLTPAPLDRRHLVLCWRPYAERTQPRRGRVAGQRAARASERT